MHYHSIAVLLCLLAVSFSTHIGYYNSYAPAATFEKCVYRDLILSPGESGQPEGCCECFYCGPNQRGFIERCNEIIVNLPCHLGEYTNPEATFPQCCERNVICPVY
ncbi:uncharacterized protein LOC131995102 [Stomoxys calcitrans]|uniref:uncharacterized protein LOC131995102 n=1 Tax=Stomoxys calcitrans TaxID=35570 RepID=UPI0027E2921D|nr:uncharacterized protein LOC131995102 [Stomoxys calcitrans]